MSFADLLEEDVKVGKLAFKNLALGGGGILGIALCGALGELHKMGLMRKVRNFAGTSAGSIAAGALACGASLEFLTEELSRVDFASFLDYGNKVKAVYNLYNYKGICSGEVFESWYADILQKLTGNSEITLKQIHEKYGGRLVITATSLNQRKVVYLDWRTYPNLPLKIAVRMSMSLPFIFIPVEYDGDFWVDGGVLDNYPMKAFHKETINSDRINHRTLGLMLMTASDNSITYPTVTNFWSFVEALLNCYMSQTQKIYMEPQDWARTVKIQCGKISSFNFYITSDEKKELLQAGRDAVANHFGNTLQTSQPVFLRSLPITTGHNVEDDETPVNSPEGTLAIPISNKRRAPAEKPPYNSTPPIDIPIPRNEKILFI